MFGWDAGLGLPSVALSPEQERRPPPPPTPLDFPVYSSSLPKDTSRASLSDLYELLSSIRRPQDVSPSRFHALNLSVQPGLSASDIISPDRLESLPPRPWEPPVDHPPVLMSNDKPYPPRDRYDLLKDELLINNEDAFREVARLPRREGRPKVRITQTRKFWSALEKMAQYWDSSLDHYYDRPATPNTQRDSGAADKRGASREQDAPNPMDIDDQPTQNSQNGSDGTPMVTMYTGRRTGTGHEMPEDIREETIRTFTEMAAWPFGCQVSVPTLPPRLSVRTLLFPIRQSFGAARSPKDRQLARKGVMEGPLIIGQCRPETTFREAGEACGTAVGEACDLYREVGAMLLAAQERAREGITEVKPGEGKWWTTRPRWGGAPNFGIEGDADNTDEAPRPESEKREAGSSRKRSKHGHPLGGSRWPGNGRRLSNSERWKLVQPGPSLWDKRMVYKQIGKIHQSPFDDIYMVSSINHHVAILHLRVHRRYLEILTTGTSEAAEGTDSTGQGWDELKLRRTRWYDLLDGSERLEAFQGVWSIFHYLMRTTG